MVALLTAVCGYNEYKSGNTCKECAMNALGSPNEGDFHTNTSCKYCPSNMHKGEYPPYDTPNKITACGECPKNAKCDGSENLICNQNYWGTTTCKQCTNAGADYGKTLAAGKKYETDCYITNFVDDTGSGKFNPRCFYSN